MENSIKVEGFITFDIPNITKKQVSQSEWKRVGMIIVPEETSPLVGKVGNLSDCYSWFITKEYEFPLVKPMRGPHISFINDGIGDIAKGLSVDESTACELWDAFVEKYEGCKITFWLSVSPRAKADGTWWLNIPEENRVEIHNIRKEIGLGRPEHGLHLTIGRANEKNVDKSNEVLNLINKGLLW